MSPLQIALSQLQEDIDSYGQGTARQPREGTADWYLLRAQVLGMSWLRRLNDLQLDQDVDAAERMYRNGAKYYKGEEYLVDVMGGELSAQADKVSK